jgi:vancomycin resistance protein VanW
MEWQNRPQRWPQTECDWSGRRFEVRSALFVDDREAERAYELGKVQNLRAALPYLHGVEIPAGEIFSFWRQVGRATHGRGFVRGRMVQAGCVVPAIGGGLCQLSNALYELALRTGCEIVERHAHSHRLAGMPQHDATVAWN